MNRNLDDARPRPWRRYWARMLDTVGVHLVVGFGAALFFPGIAAAIAEMNGYFLYLIVGGFIIVPAEGFLLSRFGTTPGKAMLGLRVVRDDGSLLGLYAACSRTVHMWGAGLGLGFPILSLFMLAQAKRRLEADGITSWDRGAGSQVRYTPGLPASAPT